MQIIRGRVKLIPVIGILISVLFLVGCKESSISGLKFNHRQHLDLGLSCEVCHTEVNRNARAGMPTHENCQLCHPINIDKPDKTCLKCHLTKEQEIKSPVPPIFKEIQFSHPIHLESGLECKTCHPKIDKSLSIDGAHYPAMEDCLQCHKIRHVKLDCQTCHPGWDKDHPPLWHKGDWKKFHGEFSTHKNSRCTVCHRQSSCTECHSIEEPVSHNQFWKQRGHALTVSWERKKCMICHRPDFCQKCHENTPPSSHRAGWSSNHCYSCHLPKSDTNCMVCHQNPQHSATTNVRDALPDQPDLVDYMAANNCMLCHYNPESGISNPPHPPQFPCTYCHFFD